MSVQVSDGLRLSGLWHAEKYYLHLKRGVCKKLGVQSFGAGAVLDGMHLCSIKNVGLGKKNGGHALVEFLTGCSRYSQVDRQVGKRFLL